MNKYIFAIVAATCVIAPVTAKAPQEMIVRATSAPPLSEWVGTASLNLTRALERVNLYRYRVGSGITYVQFNCDESGKPTNIRTSYSSRDNGLDMVGRATLRRMGSLHPLFSGARPGQLFEAAIIVGSNERQIEDMTNRVQQRAHKRNSYFAARGMPNAVISLAAVRKG